MKIFRTFLFVVITILFSCENVAEKKKITWSKSNLPIVNFDSFESFMDKKNDSIYVINFWATWCAPCIEELPYFEEIGEKYANEKVSVILASLDMSEHLESKVIPFANKTKLTSKVVLLDDVRSHYWIPKVDSTWSGAIPATYIYNATQQKFYEKPFTYEELETELKYFMQ